MTEKEDKQAVDPKDLKELSLVEFIELYSKNSPNIYLTGIGEPMDRDLLVERMIDPSGSLTVFNIDHSPKPKHPQITNPYFVDKRPLVVPHEMFVADGSLRPPPGSKVRPEGIVIAPSSSDRRVVDHYLTYLGGFPIDPTLWKSPDPWISHNLFLRDRPSGFTSMMYPTRCEHHEAINKAIRTSLDRGHAISKTWHDIPDGYTMLPRHMPAPTGVHYDVTVGVGRQMGVTDLGNIRITYYVGDAPADNGQPLYPTHAHVVGSEVCPLPRTNGWFFDDHLGMVTRGETNLRSISEYVSISYTVDTKHIQIDADKKSLKKPSTGPSNYVPKNHRNARRF